MSPNPLTIVTWLKVAEAKAKREAQAAAAMHFPSKSSYWAGYSKALKEFRAELGLSGERDDKESP